MTMGRICQLVARLRDAPLICIFGIRTDRDYWTVGRQSILRTPKQVRQHRDVEPEASSSVERPLSSRGHSGSSAARKR
jgi:hypothetical protein